MTVMKHGREKAVRFGVSAPLVGVMTEAAAGTNSGDRPGFVFLNSGILHRVGSCRLHVRMARALSAAGFHSMRFDFSGMGDSDQRRDALPYEESAVVETQEAMDHLAKTKGVRRFVLVGLCSGADMAHETAVKDPRVAGLVELDAWAYRTLGHHLRHYAPKLLDVAVWRNSLAIRWRMMRGTYVDPRTCVPGSEGVEIDVPKYVRVFPPRDRVANDLRNFVSRGIAMYNIWTGGLQEYNHRGQHASTFKDVPFGALLREEHLPDADHILTALPHQDYVIRSVVEWGQGLAPAGVAAGAPPVESARPTLAGAATRA
jgi:pimeloyl-ACP methyl ester carboxylesterase